MKAFHHIIIFALYVVGAWKLTHGHQMDDGTWHLEDGVRRQEKSSKGSGIPWE